METHFHCCHLVVDFEQFFQVYTDNPKMGNPADCDTQLGQYEKEIESIIQQIAKFRLLLEEAQQQSNQPIG